MTQVDVEHIVYGDAKVACETLIGEPPNPKAHPMPPYADPDMPAESVSIGMDDHSVLHWLDSIHPVYDRDDSTKGTTNPKSQLHVHHQNPNPNPTSQRFSGNLKPTTKAQIISLPVAGMQQSGYIGHSARRHPPPIFTKKGGKDQKPGASVAEPGSPKVSCFGKVLSDRDRRNPAAGEDGEAPGFLSSFAGVFRCFHWRETRSSLQKESPLPERNIPARRSDAWSVGTSTAELPAPPGLGGMKRFVSRRRSASWGSDVEAGLDGGEERHVAWSGPLVLS